MMFLSLSSIFDYLSASPNSRCIVEGEAVLAANHVIVCGVKEKVDKKWMIRSYCLQTSAVKSDPHEINGIFSVISDCKVEIQTFTCSCKAGTSESCKHVAATLLFCSRKPLEELEELSSTDTECLWKVQKTRATDKYLPQPLNKSQCFRPSNMLARKRSFSKEEVEEMFQLASSALPNSSFALHRQGRRKNVKKTKVIKEMPSHIPVIFNNSKDSPFIDNLNITIPSLLDCCLMVLESFKNEDVLEGMCCQQGTLEWKRRRKNKITGSTCYSIYTFKKQDWTKMLGNFFNPKSLVTKEMRYGSEHESFGLEAFQNMNPNLKIEKIGIIICEKYPWLAYSPDGIAFEDGKPSRLIEIKCPYLGKIKSATEVIPTLRYLNSDCTLKQNHPYYGQIQFGMALLNIRICEFIVYFPKENNYLQISVPFDEGFAKQLIERVSKKYFEKMIHTVCG